MATVRREDEEKSSGNKYSLPYGIAKGLGLDTKGMTPSQVWDMLSKYKVTPENAYHELEKKAKKEIEEDKPKVVDTSKRDKQDPLPSAGTFSPEDYSEERKANAIWCQTKEESYEQFGAEAKEVLEKATEFEKLSVSDYTAGSGKFNRPLRGYDKSWGAPYFKGVGKVDLNNEGAEKEIEALTNLIKQSTYDKDIWLQRGVNWDGAKQLLGLSGNVTIQDIQNLIESEETITDHAFSSCGAAKSTGFPGNVVFNIYCPKGTQMLFVDHVSQYKGENEMILQRGTTFKVTKVSKAESGQGYVYSGGYYIDLEVVSQDV